MIIQFNPSTEVGTVESVRLVTMATVKEEDFPVIGCVAVIYRDQRARGNVMSIQDSAST